MLIEIKTLAELKELFKSDKFIVVDFYAEWCGPCLRAMPKVAALSEKYPNVGFYKINYDTPELKIAIKEVFKVTSLPTFCFFKNTKYISRVEGADEQVIEEMISKYA